VLKDADRLCDVCRRQIPAGSEYRRRTMASLAAALLALGDEAAADPTFVVNDDGTVTMELCLACSPTEGEQIPNG
jgi:hypothetical protein